ncbi:MAG: thiolase C-terminal domain-containing protein [Desertimonas sp.]
MNGSGEVAIVGIGETTYYKRGRSPVSELMLSHEAIRNAAADAGLDPRRIDGYASFSDDNTKPAALAAALGAERLSYSNMVWGAGGGGCAAAVGNAAAAVQANLADYVVVYRGLAQAGSGRFGRGDYPGSGEPPYLDFFPYGVFAPVQGIALQVRRFMHDHGITQDPLAAVALTSNRHAQRNPRALMYGRPLTRQMYDESRWIAEPFHLYDCCQESDGAAAVIVTSMERARDLDGPSVRVLGGMQGAIPRFAARDASNPTFGSANFPNVAKRLYERTGVTPDMVDVVQVYENFTGGVVTALIEHGFCAPEEANDFMTEDTFRWDGGRLPLNTSGGNLAEAYIHGLELVVEAVRQLRGQSTAQVAGARTAMVVGGPYDQYVSNLLLRKEES